MLATSGRLRGAAEVFFNAGRGAALCMLMLSAAPPPPDDDALMLRAAAGDEAAYGVLVERYQRRLRGFCRVMLRDEVVAYDLAQDVFLKIWASRSKYRARGRFKEFLFIVARNTCRSYARKRAVYDLLGLSPGIELQANAADAPEQEAQLRSIELALLRLPERFRVPLTLRFVEGLDYAQIARVIGRTESAARSRIFYGLKQLVALMPEEVLP